MKLQKTKNLPTTARRGGAVIIVVLALLSSLAFIGLFFYSLSDSEREVATAFAQSPDQIIDPDPVWDLGLEQIIVSTRPQFDRSALASNMQSMLATMLGRPNGGTFDPQLRSGGGIVILPNDSNYDGFADDGTFGIDYDVNGTIDRTQVDFAINFSAVAQTNPQEDAFHASQAAPVPPFAPDVDYTYPDANNLFLAYDSFTVDPVSKQRYPVVIPSFCRPQYFPTRRAISNGFEDVYENNASVRQVLRPHTQQLNADGSPRFLTNANGTAAQSGDRNRIIAPFPTRIDVDQDGVFNEVGVFTWDGNPATPLTYEYDVDNDGDGVTDSIWLDLDHPIIDLADGRQVVPMYAAKIIDLDALLNVNAHGNLNGVFYGNRKLVEDDIALPSPPAWSNLPFGESNQGLSPGEVNLGLGLVANPTSAAFIEQTPPLINSLLVPHIGTFGIGDIPPQVATANMELLMILAGRAQFDSSGAPLLGSPPLPGRWGDDGSIFGFSGLLASRMYNNDPAATLIPPLPDGAAHPAPGVHGADDDADSNQYAYTAPPPQSRYGHPLDTLGVGEFTALPTSGTNHGAQRALLTPSALSATPVQYPGYSSYWMRSRQDQNDNPLLGAELQPNSRSSNHDEPDETIVEPALRDGDDNVFDPAETFALHAADEDRRSAGVASRLMDLAPFNLRDNRQASEVRQQFTTDSWDRLESSIARSPGRPWEFNDWQRTETVNGVTETFDLAFPPKFRDIAVFDAADPFRNPVRTVLARNLSLTTPQFIGYADRRNGGLTNQRLDVNRLLDRILANGQPDYRWLTDHPADPGAAAIVWPPDPTTAPYPPANDQEQEFWARYDRQRMARDIYVLLYTLGGGQDAVDYSTAANTATGPDVTNDPTGSLGLQLRLLYDDVQLLQMAQFAVNLVDDLDPDNVITRFEFDIDLSNGWNVNDNPYDDIAGETDRRLAMGVEGQQLTISESLFVLAQQESSDVSATQWNDALPQTFAYTELQNASAGIVDLTTGRWSLAIQVVTAGAPVHERQLIFRNGTIAPAGLYTLGSAGDSTVIDPVSTQPYSELHVDPYPSTPTAPVRIVPVASPMSLDLIAASDSGIDYDLLDTTNTAVAKGEFFPASIATLLPTGGYTIEVSLRRRAYLDRTTPALADAAQNADNPWVEVDRMVVDVDTDDGWALFDLPNVSPSNAEMLVQLQQLRSEERPQPFHRDGEDGYQGIIDDPLTVVGATWHGSTLGNTNHSTLNLVSGGRFTLWQPHHDRDFTSIIDLLSIPLYGPQQTTDRLAVGALANPRMSGFYNALSGPQPAVAAGRFLFPQDPSNITTPIATQNAKLNNRWYRILETLQVDSQSLRSIEPSVAVRRRVPGRINLNTLRHENVLAALVDDRQLRGLPADFSTAHPTDDFFGFADDLGAAGRNWFDQLLIARDGIDPILRSTAGAPLLPIPGSVGSKPFRSFGYLDPTAHSTDPAVHTEYDYSLSHTLLRGHLSQFTVRTTNTDPAFPGLELFSARANDDVTLVEPSGSDTNLVDYYTRNRLLAKIANNSTNRSHIFGMWLTVGYFEADQPGADARIGAQAVDLPIRKLFCIVDMTRLEEAFVDDPTDAQPGRFDFRKFIIYRKRIK